MFMHRMGLSIQRYCWELLDTWKSVARVEQCFCAKWVGMPNFAVR